jgi:C-terminal processing protease CtpA/Prc
VVLADCNSASCSELTASLVQLMPQGTFIGERTYGATCPLLPGGHDILYSGVFGDYDTYGYYVYTSNFDVVTKEYKSLEGIGVTPDIECPLDINDVIEGRDNQLERALQFIRTGK